MSLSADREVLERPSGVHCASGFRAGIAASLLDRAGHDVVLVDDDFTSTATLESSVDAFDASVERSVGGQGEVDSSSGARLVGEAKKARAELRRESERLRVPQPLIKRRIASGRGAMEQPNATSDGGHH